MIFSQFISLLNLSFHFIHKPHVLLFLFGKRTEIHKYNIYHVYHIIFCSEISEIEHSVYKLWIARIEEKNQTREG